MSPTRMHGHNERSPHCGAYCTKFLSSMQVQQGGEIPERAIALSYGVRETGWPFSEPLSFVLVLSDCFAYQGPGGLAGLIATVKTHAFLRAGSNNIQMPNIYNMLRPHHCSEVIGFPARAQGGGGWDNLPDMRTQANILKRYSLWHAK